MYRRIGTYLKSLRNASVSSLLPPGINRIHVIIFDERSFTPDEKIAWAEIPIPQSIFNGETHEEWFPLSGKQGEGIEGTINIILSLHVSIILLAV